MSFKFFEDGGSDGGTYDDSDTMYICNSFKVILSVSGSPNA
jgi:hypothetical protein